jgi:hypothetical protein
MVAAGSRRRAQMRERALKAVLVVVGLLFTALAYPLVAMGLEETLQMMLSLYAAMGIFLLIASRNPAAHRSLIAYAGWANITHAAVMVVQSLHDAGERMHLLIGVAGFGTIGLALVALLPWKKQTAVVA